MAPTLARLTLATALFAVARAQCTLVSGTDCTDAGVCAYTAPVPAAAVDATACPAFVPASCAGTGPAADSCAVNGAGDGCDGDVAAVVAGSTSAAVAAEDAVPPSNVAETTCVFAAAVTGSNDPTKPDSAASCTGTGPAMASCVVNGAGDGCDGAVAAVVKASTSAAVAAADAVPPSDVAATTCVFAAASTCITTEIVGTCAVNSDSNGCTGDGGDAVVKGSTTPEACDAVTFAWVVSADFADCTTTPCYAGETLERAVTCEASDGSAVTDEASSCTAAKPETTKTCVAVACPACGADFVCSGEATKKTKMPAATVCAADPCLATDCCKAPPPPPAAAASGAATAVASLTSLLALVFAA